MALDLRAKVSAARIEGPRLRIIDTVSVSVIFAASGAGDVPLVKGTVVAFNTSTNKWVELDLPSGINGTAVVKGIVMDDKTDPLVLKNADEVVGVVMLAGEAHRDDLVTNGGTSAQLDAVLQSGARSEGLIIRGLEEIR